MVFSTPCCTSARLERFECLGPRHWLAVLALLLCCALALPIGVRAQAQPVQHAGTQPPAADSTMQLERSDDGVYLSATLALALPSLVEDALHKGIAIYFVTEAEVARERWYWSDKQIVRAVRYLRLSYQPLTRRWRLNVSSAPFEQTGLGVVLGQNFDDLDEVLDAMQRIARWKIAEPDAITAGTRYRVELDFRIDLSQLPRPLHIGVLGRSGWDLALVRSQLLMAEPSP